jgi:NADH:ubiquinone oxidoreductase subunit E
MDAVNILYFWMNKRFCMAYEHEITICLGSSCFSRGNKSTLHAIKNYLEKNQLTDRVYFHGAHCYGNCDKGPVMKVDDKMFENVSENQVSAILDEYFS